jgi:hypothetical protein
MSGATPSPNGGRLRYKSPPVPHRAGEHGAGPRSAALPSPAGDRARGSPLNSQRCQRRREVNRRPRSIILVVMKTYDVHLVQTDGSTIGTGKYDSHDGKLPNVGDVIHIDEHGGRAWVTDVWPDDNPPIRAQLFE